MSVPPTLFQNGVNDRGIDNLKGELFPCRTLAHQILVDKWPTWNPNPNDMSIVMHPSLVPFILVKFGKTPEAL